MANSVRATNEDMGEEPLEPIRMLAIDIDGTLLTPQQHISPRTKEAIRAAQEMGIIVTLATARRYSNSKQFADELGIEMPLITCDGALIIHHPDGSVLHTHSLPGLVAQQAIEIIVRNKVQPIIHHINGKCEETLSGLVEFDNQSVQGYFRLFPKVHRMPHSKLCLGRPDPLRVVAFASEEEINRMVPEVAQLPCWWNTLQRGNYDCAELSIMNKACSKATGVAALARHLNISLPQVMALGDHTNDIEMLSSVGWGVAMGQAPGHVQALAHAVTATNAEDGAALAIERYALSRSRNATSNSLKR